MPKPKVHNVFLTPCQMRARKSRDLQNSDFTLQQLDRLIAAKTGVSIVFVTDCVQYCSCTSEWHSGVFAHCFGTGMGRAHILSVVAKITNTTLSTNRVIFSRQGYVQSTHGNVQVALDRKLSVCLNVKNLANVLTPICSEHLSKWQ